MAYNGLTNLGVEYLARMIAENKPVTFTKIKVGNGSIPASQTGASTTNLYSLKKEVEILSKNQIENSIKLQVLLNNLDLEVGFYVKELGIYVQDGEQEKLYWYINKDNPSYLPDKNTPSTHRYNLFLEVSNLETNIINFTGEGLLADKKFVEDSINEVFSNFEEEYHETINTLLPKGTVPASLNSAEKIASALQANTGIKFDPDLLYLNYEGTKKVGYCYLDELADGIYECIKETTTTFNDSACFKNISNKNNSDRLDNLFEINNINANEKFIIINSLYIRFGNVQFNNYYAANHRYRVDLPNNYNIISVQATQKGVLIEEQISNNIGYDQYAENIIQFFWGGTQGTSAQFSYIILAIIN